MLQPIVCTQLYIRRIQVFPTPPQLFYRPRDIYTRFARGKCPQCRHNRDADRQTSVAHNEAV